MLSIMREKVNRNQRLYEFHLKHPNMSYATLGRIFKHKHNGQMKPLDASAVCRILKREKQRLEIDCRGSQQDIGDNS